MIDRETLTRISKIMGLKLFQQEKNYVQTVLLRSIYSKVSRELTFKGGTALALFYGLNRFSEDLDFTLEEDFDLQDLMKEIKRDFEALDMEASFKVLEDSPRSFSLRIGAEGPLFTREIERCYVRVDVSKTEKVLRAVQVKELRPMYPDILPFFVVVMDPDEILAEKAKAMVSWAKARDLYDLWFLLNMNAKIDLELIGEKLQYYEKDFRVREFMENVRKLRRVWERELRPVVVGSLPKFEEVEKGLSCRFLS
jgi:predicted nucleotidyltransferase component of viral defense system